MSENTFFFNGTFTLESGAVLNDFHLKYKIYNPQNLHNAPVLWVIHALTGDYNVEVWWEKAFEPFLREYPVICVNNPGSCYGSISPLSINPVTQKPFYRDFPLITTRDTAQMLNLLRKHLNISNLYLLIGGSLGAQIGVEWLCIEPKLFQKSILIAGNAQHSAWGIAFNEAQRMAIYSDKTYFEDAPEGGKTGLKAARAMAMLSYRSYTLYNQNQTDNSNKTDCFKASSYQNYQGEKLSKRFDAYSYVALTKTMDAHNIFRNRQGNPLQKVSAQVTYVGISSDILFPLSEQEFLHSITPHSTLEVLHSDYGHDAFLIQQSQMQKIIQHHLSKNQL